MFVLAGRLYRVRLCGKVALPSKRCFWGFYEGKLLRRVDPQHRSLGQFFQDEIASRLGEDVYIRLPETIPNLRLATLAPPDLGEMLRGFGLRFMLEVINPRSNINRALNTNPGTARRRCHSSGTTAAR